MYTLAIKCPERLSMCIHWRLSVLRGLVGVYIGDLVSESSVCVYTGKCPERLSMCIHW